MFSKIGKVIFGSSNERQLSRLRPIVNKINDLEKEISKGDTIIIPQGAKHRIENKGLEKLIFIEVQTGSYFGEDDIVRVEDDYNRI